MGEFWAFLVSGGVVATAAEVIFFFVRRNDGKKNANADIKSEVAELRKDVGRLADRFDEEQATNARIRILGFSDEVRHGVRHSKESFDQVNLDIDTYRRYCDDHPDYKNNRAVMAIANIERVYANCLREQDFLE